MACSLAGLVVVASLKKVLLVALDLPLDRLLHNQQTQRKESLLNQPMAGINGRIYCCNLYYWGGGYPINRFFDWINSVKNCGFIYSCIS